MGNSKKRVTGVTDATIRSWLNSGKPFERSVGDGLTLRFREGYEHALWRLRYRFANTPRVVLVGSRKDLTLAQARAEAKLLRAGVTLGEDAALKVQERKREAVAKIEAAKNVMTVARLADEYFKKRIEGGSNPWKHPDIVRRRIEKDIRPNLGKLSVKDVKPRHIQDMLDSIIGRGAPTIANDVLRWTRRMFNYAVKLDMVQGNPASAFDLSDAGGKEEARERALSRDELVKFFQAMRKTPGLSVENLHTFKLLLLLAVRKGELVGARVAEFDLKAGEWKLPAERTKTNAGIDIPLVPQALDALRELMRLGKGSDYLLPARKAQERMLPHIHENTLNVALAKVRAQMGIDPKDMERRFTVHDLRRTARTQLSALKVDPFIAERCLNHKIKGVQGVYDRHAYFDERREALTKWAHVVDECEAGKPAGVLVAQRKEKTRGR